MREVVATVRDDDGSLAEAADHPALPVGPVEAAAAHHADHRAEIDAEVAADEEDYERGLVAAVASGRALSA